MKNPVRFLTQRLLASAVLLQALFFFTLDLPVQAAVNKIYVLTAGTTNSAEAADRLNSVNSDGTSDTTLASGATALFHIPQRMAVDAANNFAYVIDSDSANAQFHLLKVNLTTGSATSIFDHSSTGYNLKDVKIDFTNNLLYVLVADGSATAGGSDSLFKMDFSGGNISTVASSIGNVPQAMALDVAGGFAYFMDSNQKKIFKIALTGGAVSLFQDVSASASGFTSSCLDIDTTNGILYYTGAGGTTGAEAADALYKVGLASGSPTALSSGGSIGIPKALAVDVPNGFAYVGDNSATTGRSVYKVDLTSGAQTLVNTPTGSPGGLNDLAIANVAAAPTPAGVLAIGTPASNQLSSSLAYTVPAGTNRLLVVHIAQDLVPTIPTPTFNGQTMTLGVHKDDGSTAGDSIFYLKLGDGAAISSTITATSNAAFIGASAYTNVDQTTPVTSPVSFNTMSGGNSPGLTVTSATGDLVIDMVDSYQGSTETPGGGQTQVHQQLIPSHSAYYRATTKPGAASVTMSWTTNGTAIIHAAMNIHSRASFTAPTIATAAATSVLTTTATLNGTITPNGTPAVSTFDYGLTNAYGSTANGTPITSSSTGAVSAAINGLTPNTLYHFRANAINGTTINGSDMTFTTAAAAPTVSSINPTSGTTAGGTPVTITGTGFTGATSVTIGGTAATGVTVTNDTTITCTTPVGSAGTASVLVTTPGGTNSANTLYTYVAASVTTLTNLAATTDGQASVGLTQDFVTGSAAQQFTTGPSNLQLNTVTLNFNASVGITGASQPLNLAIYSNVTNAPAVINPTTPFTPTPNTPQPGTQIGSTLVATTNARPTTAGDYVYTATGGLLLAANTKYWIVISSAEATGRYQWNYTNSTTFTTAGGWSVDTAAYGSGAYDVSGTSYPNNIWMVYGPGAPQKFSISATTVAAPPSPTVTATTTAVLATATSITITGTNFDAVTPANNTVVFTPAGTGTVTAATSTSLTVTGVTGLRGGPLSAVVTNTGGNSGAAVQVANVAPVITVNSGNITTVANQLTINGVGFDPTAFANNSVVFSPAGTGNVVGSTSGSLNVTGISGLTAGALNAVVTVNGVASASAQVATVVAAPNLTINDVTLNEGNAGTTSFTFTVSLSSPAPTGGVTFDIATQDGTATTADSDYVAKSLTSQTIPATSSVYTFTVLVNGDTKYEPNESFFVNVTNATNAVISDGVGIGNITNDEPQPNVSINTNSAVSEGNAGTTTLNFTLSLSGASSQTITVLASTFDGTATTADNDYVANSQIISFAPGVTSMPFNVTVNGDTKAEGDETMFVRLTYPVNAGVGVSVGQGTITNDDVSTGKNYVVTTNSDATWTTLNLANGKIDGTNTVTLRSAVIAANQSGAGPHTISIPVNVGTITLTQNNPGPVATTWANPVPDLEIGSNFSTIIIQGVGGNATIVQGVAGYDVITTGIKSDGFTPAIVNLSLDHLDISGGTFTGIFVGADDGLGNANSVSRTQITNCNIHNNTNSDGVFGQGGAIQNGAGYLTVSDTIFANNSASNSATGQGGAIWYSLPNASGQGSVGSLSLTDCTFTSNTAGKSGGVGGGAVYVSVIPSSGSTFINRCVFTSNSSSADGGAIALDGNRLVLPAYCNFVTNSVTGTGHGGAIAINNGGASINYNRFAGNTAAVAANGNAIYRPATATGSSNALNNWWQTNAGAPANAVVGAVTRSSWMLLSLSATPNAIPLLGTSALQADFFTTSATAPLTLQQVYALIGLPTSYGAPLTLGTLSNSDTFLHADGKALSTYNAGSTSGVGTASVTIDGQTVTANITVGSAAADSSLASLSASAGALSPAFTSGNIGPYAVSAPNATTTTTITPTATNGASTLSYNVNGGGFTAISSGNTSSPITLNAAGVNTPIIVKVISADTTTTTQYTLNVTRAAAGAGAPTTLFTSGVDSPPGAPGTTFASIRSGMAIASSGALAFRGYLTIGGSVDANNYMGMWKSPDGSAGAVALVARSGSVAPDTGSGLFDILPVNAVINNAAQTSFLGFVRVNTGSPSTTTSTDTGVWSELSGSGLKLLLREGTAITGGTVTATAPSTWVATGATKAAFTVQFAGGSALVRGGFTGVTPAITTLATEGGAAPGGGTFDSFVGNGADPRMDATDDVAFLGYLQSSGTPGIWYQSAAGSLVLAVKGGQTTAGMADTFIGFERPSLGNATSLAFRAFLGTNNQAVFRGDPATPASILPVAVNGYTSAQIPTIPAGRKLWSLWSPFSASSGRIAFRASLVDTAGNTNENRAILADTSGTMTVIAKVGDSATGIAGETFANFDHPVIGDGNQAAFVASTNAGSVGLWREAAGGGALALVLKVGDVLTISGTPETVASITIPGSSSDDRKYETETMDSAGHVLIHVTYASGKTGIILSAP